MLSSVARYFEFVSWAGAECDVRPVKILSSVAFSR